MKRCGETFKKFIVLSVLALYFFMVATYISFLPKKNVQAQAANSLAAAGHLQRDGNTANSIVQLHCSFKSVPESKRKALALLLKTGAAVFILLLFGDMLNALASATKLLTSTFNYTFRYSYLSLRTLRI